MEYGLVGRSVALSFSKQIHAYLGNDAYELCSMDGDAFRAFMERRDFRGINVTMPYKRDVIPYLSEMDAPARAIGAVNTVVNRGGRLTGYNTDYPGFLYMMNRCGVSPAGKKVVVLGNGGAAQAVLAVLRDQGAAQIIIAKPRPSAETITTEDCIRLHSDAQLIVNTSPVGMAPHSGETPLDLSSFRRAEAVLDIIYNPLETRLLREAAAKGLVTAGGLTMLVAQAKYAAEFFTGTAIPDAKIEEIIGILEARLRT